MTNRTRKPRPVSPLGQRVQREIDARGWRTENLASESGLSYDCLRKLLRGASKSADPVTLNKLAAALAIPVGELTELCA